MVFILNNNDRKLLYYKPNIGYKPNILTIIKTKEYKSSKIVDSLCEVLPSDLLEIADKITNRINYMQDKMESNLKNVICDGISFKEYKNELEKENKNYNIINSFENYCSDDLNGSIQGEVYPMLNDLKNDILESSKIFSDFIYNNDTPNKDLDIDYINNVINKDSNKLINLRDKNKITSKLHVTDYFKNKLSNISEFLNNIDNVLSATLQEYYNGNIVDVIQKYNECDTTLLNSMKEINNVRYKQSVLESKATKQNNEKLNSTEFKNSMFSTLCTVAEKKNTIAIDLLEWCKSQDFSDTLGPQYQLIEENLDNVEFIFNEYEHMLVEVYKQNKLDSMLKSQIFNSLDNKKKSRFQCNTLTNMQENKKSNTFEINQFISNNQLEYSNDIYVG